MELKTPFLEWLDGVIDLENRLRQMACFGEDIRRCDFEPDGDMKIHVSSGIETLADAVGARIEEQPFYGAYKKKWFNYKGYTIFQLFGGVLDD